MSGPVLHHRALGVHPGAFVGNDPPVTADLQDHVLWIDISAAPVVILKYWDAATNAWIPIVGGVDTTGVLSADCVTFPHAAVLCNPSTDLVTLVTPSGEHEYDPTGYTLPGGSRLEIVSVSLPASFTLASTAGQGKTVDLGVGGTPPSGWTALGFDDSAWSAVIATTYTSYLSPVTGSAWITATNGTLTEGNVMAHRDQLSLPAGTVTAASLVIWADNYLDGVYINGTVVYDPGSSIEYIVSGGTHNFPDTVTIDPSLLSPGADNILAVLYRNGAPQGGANPQALDYKLSVTIEAAGQQKVRCTIGE